MEPLAVDAREAARLTSLSVPTIRAYIRRGKHAHPVLAEGTVRRSRNKDNGYVEEGAQRPMDFRSRFRTKLEMAVACQESMGTIVDRSHENLGPNDGAVEGARKMLIDTAVDLMEGTVPVIVHKGEAYRVRSYTGGVDRDVPFDEDEEVRRGVIAQV